MDAGQFQTLMAKLEGISKQLENAIGLLATIEGNTAETDTNTRPLRESDAMP